MFGIKKKNGGLMDEIRCDEPDYLIWKWHPSGSIVGDNTRENAIRWGSSLRVKDGSVAVFVYKQNNGVYQDFIEGPYDEIVSTKNLPIIASIIGLAYDGGTPFQAEVYFINLAKLIQSKFAVPFFDIYDPRFPDFGVPVAVRGTISYKINDYREFIKLHRLDSFSQEDFQKQIRDAVIRYTKDIVTNIPMAKSLPVIQIETQIETINESVESGVSDRLLENFGVKVSGVDVSTIEIDKASESYRQLMAVTKDVTATKIQAETTDYVEKLRIQREEGQYAMHKQTQSANIGAFQVEKQAEVGIAGANALGQMGANGAGLVDLGGNGAEFNPAAMMASMAVGGAVGQNIAGTMNGIMSGVNQQQNTMTHPPIPETVYNIAVNGQSTGPYNLATLSQMAQAGQINSTTLVWKPGMANWAAIADVQELAPMLSSVPPEIK